MHHARNTGLATQQIGHLLKQKYALQDSPPARSKYREAGGSTIAGGA